MSAPQPNFHLPVAIIGNEVPDEVRDNCINWYFCYKEDVDQLDLKKYAAVIVSGFFGVDDAFILKLKAMVLAGRIGVILRKNESFSNKMGFTRGQIRHFHNFSKTTCRLHNRTEHDIVTKYAFYTMNMPTADFSYCYYLSLNNLVDDKDIIQLDSSAYGYTFAVHSSAPLIYYFFESEKQTAPHNKFLMLSCLKWIHGQVRSNIHRRLHYVPNTPDFSVVETKQRHSDIRFNVDGRLLWANKKLLAYKSEYFDAMLFGQMQEATMDEIPITDCPYETFRSILQFMVTGQVQVDDANVYELVVHADKYGSLEGLKDRCTNYLVGELLRHGRTKYSLEDVWNLIMLGTKHSLDKILKVCAHWAVNHQIFFREKLQTIEEQSRIHYWVCQTMLEYPYSGVIAITDITE